jgi:type III restriction enzyme
VPLVFQAPTGSGKTVMMAQFLRDLTGDPQFDTDKAFLWFTFSEESYEQSKKKFWDYLGGASELSLLDLNDLNNHLLEKNQIFFINWQKIKSTTAEGRILRKPNEQGITFDSFIKKTQEAHRELVLIVDEAHRDSDTPLADDLVDLVDPRIIIKVTATPREIPSAADTQRLKAGYVDVPREDVVESGLIKERIVTETAEDLIRIDTNGIGQDDLLLTLAIQKRKELIGHYKKLNLQINPLVLIQLPSETKGAQETLSETKLDSVREFLKAKDIPEKHIAIWLSEEKENLEEIEKDNSEISFLIFKQAAATGWDCPRASILVMFREIKNPIFHTQTLGRILRMPGGVHYPVSALNLAYLYTNYERNHILAQKNKLGANRPAIYPSARKENVKQIEFESIYLSRTDYNDLGDTFQYTFAETAGKAFGFTRKESSAERRKKLVANGFDINVSQVSSDLIIDAEIDDYDDFVEQLRERGTDKSFAISPGDVKRLYDLWCFNIIHKQSDENRKFAPERSWGKLKTALNVWLLDLLDIDRESLYKIIVSDFLKGDGGKLKPIISMALERYRPIREREVFTKSERARRVMKTVVPPDTLRFTDLFEEIKVVNRTLLKKCAMEPFYNEKEYEGKQNEERFIGYLENQETVLWWHKNGNYGSEFFAVEYYDKQNNKQRMFYPDWIIKTDDKIYIVDTKAGFTATSEETKYKADALQKWAKNQKRDDLIAGIVVEDDHQQKWMLNSNEKYEYDPNFREWDRLSFD